MTERAITTTDLFLSSKRIEALLEEMIFQLIVLRSEDVEKANEAFKDCLKNVSNSVNQMLTFQNS
jgi:hypothetical protein